MTEPRTRRLRRTPMKLSAALALATLSLLASGLASGCGQQQGSTTETERSDNKIGSCTRDDAGVVHALAVYTSFDLDHDGVGNALMVTRPDSTCPNVMFSKVGDHVPSLELKDVALDLASAQRVIVPGRDGDLMAIREVHPRGGFQVHLYAYADNKLAEVRTPDGDLILPFVATDTKGGYVSASCVDNGLVVRQAVAHKPPGVVSAWDIQETSYRLDGTTAKVTGTEEAKDNVLDHDLAKDYPELVGREMFKSGCGP